MTPRPNVRLIQELPVYALLREAERRRQSEAERERTPLPWALAWLVCALLVGWVVIVLG